MPSLDAAWNCSTTSRDASKRGGDCFTKAAGTGDARSANHTLPGVRKPVTLRNTWSFWILDDATPTDTSSGKASRVMCQPLAAGVKATARPRTLSYSAATSLFCVTATSSRLWRGPGTNIVSGGAAGRSMSIATSAPVAIGAPPVGAQA